MRDLEWEKAWKADERAIYYEYISPEGGVIYKKYKPSVYRLLVKRGGRKMTPCRETTRK